MARLDAAARFTPALTKLATDAACEPATTSDEQIVQPAVRDRENTADEARSRFSMISDKSVFSHRKCRSMALHTKRSVQCLTPKSMSGTAFWQETSVEKRLPDQKLYKCRNLTASVRFTKSALFWPPNCFKLPARKQAIGHCFCRIRENPGRTRVAGPQFAALRTPILGDFGSNQRWGVRERRGSLNRVAVGLADHSGSWTTAPERS